MSTTAAADVSSAVSPRTRELVLYAATIFLSAFLLFQVQLIIAKFILPWFGGTPAVWTTCMLVFQLLLLGGYAYAHLLQKRLDQGRLHAGLLLASVVVLALLAFWWKTPILPGPSWKPQHVDHPVWRILTLLLASIGLPFLVLSTTGPLLQRWFAHGGKSPYRLYAVSNLGSLLGLLAYPFLVEPELTLPAQAWVWTAGYLFFAAGVFACAGARKAPPEPVDPASPPASSPAAAPISLPRALAWLLLPGCASALLLAVTNLICQEVAVIPFLWVVPLCIYLASFVICFDNPRWYRREIFHPLFGLGLCASLVALIFWMDLSVIAQIVLHCIALFSVAMTCHGELFRLRPDEKHLTAFYLAIATGGAVGGIFVALIAPRIFLGYYEYHVVMFASGVLLFAVLSADRRSWLHESQAWLAPFMISAALLASAIVGETIDAALAERLRRSPAFYSLLLASLLLAAWLGVRARHRPPVRSRIPWAQACALAVLLAVGWGYLQQARLSKAISRSRNFFGVLTVDPSDDGTMLGLRHGKTLHGFQFIDPFRRAVPTGYYMPDAGVGRVLSSRGPWSRRPIRVGVIGLGVGTLAAYMRPGDSIHFYEINEGVLDYSRGDQPVFSYLRDCQGRVSVSLGDGRLLLEQEAARGQLGNFDLLVVDAFSSDSVPVHLLTREAVQLYRRHLRGPQSILAFHITNMTLDLRPVVRGLAEEEKLSFKRVVAGEPSSDWMLLSADPAALQTPRLNEVPDAAMPQRQPVLWTDHFSNLAAVVKWSSWRLLSQ